jgi:hypothetical protein
MRSAVIYAPLGHDFRIKREADRDGEHNKHHANHQ